MPNSTKIEIPLSDDLWQLFSDVVQKRMPGLVSLPPDRVVRVDREMLRPLQELFADELVETGLREDSEPNRRGLQLDVLIGKFSPYRSGGSGGS